MLLRLLWRYARPYRWQLVAVLVFQFASAIATLYLPTLNAGLIDRGVALGDTGYIWRTGGLMLLVTLGQILAGAAGTWYAAKISMGIGRELRNDVYYRVSGFSEREISKFGAGSLLTRNTNDVQQVQMIAMTGLTWLINSPMLAIGGIVMALRQEADLAWIIGVGVPVLLVFALVIMWRMIPLFREYQVRLDRMNLIMREQLTGIRVVRAFVRELIEEARYRAASKDILVTGRKIGSLFVVMFPVAMLLMNGTMLMVIWFGGIEVDAGRVQIGSLMAFMQYIGQIMGGVLMGTFMTMMIPRAAVSAERIEEVLAVKPFLKEPAAPVTVLPEPGTVEFDDVSFTFAGAEVPVLDRVSFKVERGQTVALVGSTGAGKTTLLNLIPRLMDPTGGVVSVGGADVRDQAMEGLWSQLGLVPQKPFLFAGTIGSNVRLGKEDATDAEVWRALEIAQGADFVRELGGLDTRISQGGTNVSGGQRQRLAIARAVLRNPAIMLLDDSFSALDVTTDAKLRAALFSQLPDTTKVVVAQRVTTVMDADQILVLNDGRLVGVGTHAELLATNQTYREIAESQISLDDDSSTTEYEEAGK